jgi:hypothetical protein
LWVCCERDEIAHTACGEELGLFSFDVAWCYDTAEECADEERCDFEHGHECDATCASMIYDEFLREF